MFADRIKNVTASGIRKVFDLGATLKDPINLSIGQPDFEVPESIQAAAIEAISKGYNRYTVTQGIEPLRQRIVQDIETRKGIRPPGILVTSGVSGGLLLAFLVLINPGDEVIIPDPYFVMYKNLVNLVGGVPKYYDLYPDFQLKPDAVEAQITDRTKIILLNSPSNPTGVVFEDQAIRKVAAIAQKRDIIVISDEIYSSFIYTKDYPSIYSYYPQKTILLDGYSKTYGMPGWRMGYAAGPADILEKMTTLQQFSFVCAPSMAQYACLLAHDVDMTNHIENYRKKRDLIYNGLLHCGYNVVCPQGSFYVFPQTPWGTADEFCQAAIAHNMLIIPGSAFSSQNTHFRISFATSDEKLEQAIEIFRKLRKN